MVSDSRERPPRLDSKLEAERCGVPCALFPVEVVRKAQKPENTWGKVFLRDIPVVDAYIDNWDQIRSFLSLAIP
jgi:hypothetical protein